MSDLAGKMWEALNSLSEDSKKAALKKIQELNFDPNKGEIPLEESFINLFASVNILRDAVEQKKLIQLPLSIQKELLAKLEAVSKFLASLSSGADEVINLGNAIEQLNASIWQCGLHNLSNELLGCQTKMNQLKNEELSLKKLQQELENGLKLKADLEILLGKVKASEAAAQSSSKDISAASEKANAALQGLNSAAQSATASATAAQKAEGLAKEQAAATKVSMAETQALETKIKEFYAQVDQYRTKIDAVSQTAKETVETNKENVSYLIENLHKLQDQIKVQIEKATGFTLFHSFQKRQEDLSKAKKFWGVMLGVVVILSIILSIVIIFTTTAYDVAFYLKLSISIPLIYAISFCTIQYSRERKLEEEYAFKSNISISLDPYQTLVSRIIDSKQPAEREKFTTFIVDSIQKVFTSPTDKIFKSKEETNQIGPKTWKHFSRMLGQAARIAKVIRP